MATRRDSDFRSQCSRSMTEQTLAAEEPYEDEERDCYAFTMQWDDAQRRARSKLKPNEMKMVERFHRPEQLLEDLERLRQEHTGSVTEQLIDRILPCFRVMMYLYFILITSMPNEKIKITLLWGILHIIVKGQLKHDKILRKLEEMLVKMRNELKLLKRLAEDDYNAETRNGIVMVFIALINFWVEAAVFLRKSPQERALLEGWSAVNRKFESAISEIHQAIEHVKGISLTNQRRRNDTELLSTMSINEPSTTSFPSYEVPESGQIFVGRETELKKMKDFLDPSINSKKLRAYVVYGLGGVGKTALAHAFVDHCKEVDAYEAIFWIRAATSAEFIDSFGEICERLEVSETPNSIDADTRVMLVKKWLQKTKKRWLLVYDNLDDVGLLRRYLPSSSCPGPILVTTRYQDVACNVPGISEKLKLDVFNDQESADVFRSWRTLHDSNANPIGEEKDTEELLGKVGGHALAISLLATYIGRQRSKIGDFLQTYERLSRVIHRTAPGGNTHSLATVFEIHFKSIQDTDASQMLGLLSMLSPEVIPLELFSPEDRGLASDSAPWTGDLERVEVAVNTLMGAALIERSGPVISLHQMVQKAFIDSSCGLQSLGLQQRAFYAAATLLNYQFPKMGGSVSLYGRWGECAKYFKHALSLANLFDSFNSSDSALKSSANLDELLKNCAWYQYEIGEHDESLKTLRIAFDTCEDQTGLIYSQLCNNAACIYYELNDLNNCRIYNEKALGIRKKKLKGDDVDLANTYSNLGCLLLSENRLDESLEMYRKAENIERKYTQDDPEYLCLTVLSIGRVHFVKKKFDIARSHYDQAQKMASPDGWVMATVLFDIGNLELANNRLLDAKEAYEAAHRITLEKGPTHMLHGSLAYKLGMVEAGSGDFEKAIHHLDQALKIANHKGTQGAIARIKRQKGLVIGMTGNISQEKLREAKSLKEEAEKIRSIIIEGKDGSQLSSQDDDAAYDELVCGYYR